MRLPAHVCVCVCVRRGVRQKQPHDRPASVGDEADASVDSDPNSATIIHSMCAFDRHIYVSFDHKLHVLERGVESGRYEKVLCFVVIVVAATAAIAASVFVIAAVVASWPLVLARIDMAVGKLTTFNLKSTPLLLSSVLYCLRDRDRRESCYQG